MDTATLEWMNAGLMLVVIAQAAALLYVVKRLTDFGARKPWFFIKQDPAGEVEQIGALAAGQVEKPEPTPTPISTVPPSDERTIPGMDDDDNFEPVGGSAETAERVGV